MPPTASILEDRGRAGARDRDRAMHNTLPRGGYSGPALTSASPPGRWQHCAGPPRLPDRGTRLTSARRGRTVGCPRKWAGQRGRRGWNGPRREPPRQSGSELPAPGRSRRRQAQSHRSNQSIPTRRGQERGGRRRKKGAGQLPPQWSHRSPSEPSLKHNHSTKLSPEKGRRRSITELPVCRRRRKSAAGLD
ncbi:hypothetical protein NN561_013190 [Cricetulus griseus]